MWMDGPGMRRDMAGGQGGCHRAEVPCVPRLEGEEPARAGVYGLPDARPAHAQPLGQQCSRPDRGPRGEGLSVGSVTGRDVDLTSISAGAVWGCAGVPAPLWVLRQGRVPLQGRFFCRLGGRAKGSQSGATGPGSGPLCGRWLTQKEAGPR